MTNFNYQCPTDQLRTGRLPRRVAPRNDVVTFGWSFWSCPGGEPAWSAGAVPPALLILYHQKRNNAGLPGPRHGEPFLCFRQKVGATVFYASFVTQSVRQFGSGHCPPIYRIPYAERKLATGRAVSARVATSTIRQARNWLRALPGHNNFIMVTIENDSRMCYNKIDYTPGGVYVEYD